MHADEDLEGDGFACPDHDALYDVNMDPEDRTAVFDLAMDQDSDDGGLLDWDALAGEAPNWSQVLQCIPAIAVQHLSQMEKILLHKRGACKNVAQPCCLTSAMDSKQSL